MTSKKAPHPETKHHSKKDSAKKDAPKDAKTRSEQMGEVADKAADKTKGMGEGDESAKDAYEGRPMGRTAHQPVQASGHDTIGNDGDVPFQPVGEGLGAGTSEIPDDPKENRTDSQTELALKELDKESDKAGHPDREREIQRQQFLDLKEPGVSHAKPGVVGGEEAPSTPQPTT